MSYLRAFDSIGGGYDMSQLRCGLYHFPETPGEDATLLGFGSYDYDTDYVTYGIESGSSTLYYSVLYNNTLDQQALIEDVLYYDENFQMYLVAEACNIYVTYDDLSNLGLDWYLDCFKGSNQIVGTRYADTLAGGGSNDSLDGGAGKDVLRGQTGNDTLHGGSGSDRLSGSSGKDVLVGGTGADFLTGGTNIDTFVFIKAGESPAGSGRDTISDFRSGTDQIDLTDIDANETRHGNQAFHFIGHAGYSDTAGELRFKDGVLSGDVDGDGHSDFQIVLRDVDHVTAGDFLL